MTTQITRPHFNLIRLVAACQVMIVHTLNHLEIQFWPAAAFRAFPGVPVFFFASGYLITLSYMRLGSSDLVKFYQNRVLRIYPALIVCVFLTLLALLATGYLATAATSIFHISLWTLAQTTFLQFYNPDFMRSFGVGVINGALWTISVELQFYVLTPLIIYLAINKKWIFALLFSLSVLCSIYVSFFMRMETLYTKLFYVSFLPWIFIYLGGMFVALKPEAIRWVDRVPLVGLIGLYFASMFAIGGYYHNAQNSINPLSLSILCLIVWRLSAEIPAILESSSRLATKHDLSYGVYLYHMPVINFVVYYGLSGSWAAAMLVFALSVALGLFSWLVIERPALRKKF